MKNHKARREVANMNDLAKLSLSLNNPFEEDIDNHATMNQTSRPSHPLPTHPTSHPLNKSNSTNMPPTNTQHPIFSYHSNFASYPPK